MRLAHLDRKLIGKTLARSVYGPRGSILLARGTILTNSYLSSLLRHGLHQLWIVGDTPADVASEPVISEATCQQAIEEVSRVMYAVREHEEIDPEPIREAVSRIIDDVDSSPHATIDLSSLRAISEYTFEHCLRVSLYAILLGEALNLEDDQVHELGVGGLLHDIGKMAIPAAVINKSGPLTFQEMAAVRKHPEFGYDLLHPLYSISYRSACVALEHHEHYDGSGYPRQLSGREIHLFGRLTCIVDSFDAMTANRTYHQGVPPSVAARDILEHAGTWYDPLPARLFTNRVAWYPNGSIVRLSDGCLGVVSAQTDRPRYPRVRVLADDKEQLTGPYEVNTRPEDIIIAEHLPQWPAAIKEAFKQAN